MIVFKQHGNFEKTTSFMNNAKKVNYKSILDTYGQQGVRALASATPVDSGLTAASWGYEISILKGSFVIAFTNSNVQNGVPIAILLQYGHGARNGGYIQGRDYINPALRPIFDNLANSAWKEVTKA